MGRQVPAVLHPYHPGFGELGDDPAMDTFNDYVMHYVGSAGCAWRRQGPSCRLLAGRASGGAFLASQQRERVKTLTLVAPAGMRSAEYPTLDVLAMPGDKIVASLASNFDVLKPWLPTGPDPEFMGARYREATTLARLLWEKPWDPKSGAPPRIDVPTLIVWGDEDRLVPPQQAELWKKALPKAKVEIFKDAGHPVLDEKPEAAKPSPLSRRPRDPSRGPAQGGLATSPSPDDVRDGSSREPGLILA